MVETSAVTFVNDWMTAERSSPQRPYRWQTALDDFAVAL